MAIEISSTEKGLIDFFSDFIDIFNPFLSSFISRKYYVCTYSVMSVFTLKICGKFVFKINTLFFIGVTLSLYNTKPFFFTKYPYHSDSKDPIQSARSRLA